MNSKQIDTAMRRKDPVVYNGRRYKRILEYISWYDNSGNRQLSVVILADGNYTVRVPADKVELFDEK